MTRALVAGVGINEFWDLTPYELGMILRADIDRTRRTQELSAVHASWIMNVWTKRRIRPTQLLPQRPGTETVDFADFPDAESAIAWVKRREEEREDA